MPPTQPVEDINNDLGDDDFDGLNNGEERKLGTDPLDPDTDNDGLYDSEEVRTYQTNPLLDDTDNDGLSDHAEVIIYTTNPNNPDTDDDGFNDGTEVENGYNPNGSGKLEDLIPPVGNLNTNQN